MPHDLVVTNSEVELESSNVADKPAKIEFFEKFIDFLAKRIGKPVDVNPTKIIAGLEPGRTRYLLQLFIVVATSKLETPTMNGGDGMVLFEHEKLFAKSKTQMEILHDGQANASSLADPKNRPATTTGVRPQFITGKTRTSSAYVSGVVETEGRFRDRSMSADIGSDVVDANVKTSSLDNLFSSLSVNTNTRPATAHGTKPVNGKVAVAYPSGMPGSESDGMVTAAIPQINLIDKRRTDDGEEHRRNNFNGEIRPNKILNQRPNIMDMPLTLSGIDFTALASAVRHIAESTSSLGKYINAVHNDLETLVIEGNYWSDAQHD